MTVRILIGDCREVLKTLPAESVHCVVTSPPYWGLRDYGVSGQLGLEQTPDEYVAGMVAVFREVRRVLRKDGTLWLNLGDSYTANGGGGESRMKELGSPSNGIHSAAGNGQLSGKTGSKRTGLKPKDLVGIPWRVAFALQADGWWLRQDIIWAKPNPMPESVTDRCTKAHEYLFLLTKSAKYYYDSEAIAEDAINAGKEVTLGEKSFSKGQANGAGVEPSGNGAEDVYTVVGKRNKRSVWTVTTQPFSEAHFATFPPALIEPCILAGTSAHGCCSKCGTPWERQVDREDRITEGRREQRSSTQSPQRSGKVPGSNTRGFPQYDDKTTGWQPGCDCGAEIEPCRVLDPFGGAGTTGLVADRLQRSAILIELNPEYAAMAERRIHNDAPLFAQVTA